ncbi:hypothetical protein [Agrobacterium sp. NPDC089420]|uniref:hypothetical protein n=1 Tax=Agrobacterium sp. NPDC089420 TaxID=3363918 RepID=UPI00384B0F08
MTMSMDKTLEVLNSMVDDRVIETYVIAGAVAALLYIEPTVTEDLDIMITFSSPSPGGLVTLGEIVPYLKERGYDRWEKEGLLIEGWPVQFLPASDALDVEALQEAEEITEDFGSGRPITTRVLAAHHLAAIAIRTGRYKDHARVIAFFEADVVSVDHLRDVVRRHGLEVKWQEFLEKTGHADVLDLNSNP